MKTLRNLFLLTLFACAMSFTYAQDDAGPTGKNGETVLPEADDWAISFDAVPFLNYLGNFVSGTAMNNSPGLAYTNGYPWSIKGKLFMDIRILRFIVNFFPLLYLYDFVFEYLEYVIYFFFFMDVIYIL